MWEGRSGDMDWRLRESEWTVRRAGVMATTHLREEGTGVERMTLYLRMLYLIAIGVDDGVVGEVRWRN